MYRQDEQLYRAYIAAYRTTFPTFKTDLLSLEMDETTERGSDDSTHTRHTVQDEATFGPPPTNQATDIKTRKVFSAEVVLIAMVVVVEVSFLEGPSLAASSSQVSGGGISKFRITVVNRNYEDILPDSQGVTIAFQSLINHVLNGIPPIWKTEFHFLPHNALNTQPSDLFCQISMSLRQNTHCNLLNHARFLADPTRANPPFPQHTRQCPVVQFCGGILRLSRIPRNILKRSLAGSLSLQLLPHRVQELIPWSL